MPHVSAAPLPTRAGENIRPCLRLAGRAVLPLALPALLLSVWALLSASETVPAYLLPSPARVLSSLYEYALGSGRSFQGRLFSDLSASLGRVAAGFSLAGCVGLTFGVLCGRSLLARRMLAPGINCLRAVPGICWLPLGLVWLGIGNTSTVFLIALAAFFPIYLNTTAAVMSVSNLMIRSGRMLGFSGARLLFGVIMPAAAPQILTGMRLGLGLGFAYLVLGELTGVPDGLGAMIMDARAVGRVDMILCGILILALTGWLADVLFRLLAGACFPSIRRSRL